MHWFVKMLAFDAAFDGDPREFLAGLVGEDPGAPDAGTIASASVCEDGLAIARYQGRLLVFGDFQCFDEGTILHIARQVGARRAVLIALNSGSMRKGSRRGGFWAYEVYEDGRRICLRRGRTSEAAPESGWKDLAAFEIEYFRDAGKRLDEKGRPILEDGEGHYEHGEALTFRAVAQVLGTPLDKLGEDFWETAAAWFDHFTQHLPRPASAPPNRPAPAPGRTTAPRSRAGPRRSSGRS